MISNEIKVLDCTIRDGGYVNDWDFPIEMVRDLYRRVSRAGIDYFEIGFRDNDTNSKLWRRCPEHIIDKISGSGQGAKISVMVDFGKASIADFKESCNSLIDMVRVAVHKNKTRQALDLIAELKAKGYTTSIQLMGYPQYSFSEQEYTIELLEDYCPDYVYVADSYGSLIPEQVCSLISPLLKNVSYRVGFHPHNNLQLAFANTLEAIKSGVNIVDSSLYGMGRGGGNLPTEVIIAFLQKRNYTSEKYNLIQALLCVDLYMHPLSKKYEWGYQLPYMLSGMCECHPYYSKTIVESRRYTVDDVWTALNMVKEQSPIGFDKNLLNNILDEGVFEYKASMIEEVNNGASTKPSENYIKGPPTYYTRHKGSSFLILANGETLKTHKNVIDKFIDKYNPIVIGANYLGGLFIPDYHAFVNKRRFIKYVNQVDQCSRLLISCHFGENFICEYTQREYEKILYYVGNRNTFSISDGVLSNDCSSVSLLLVGVALSMGAKQVFIAGMDGYIQNHCKKALFYDKEDISLSEDYVLKRQARNERALEELDHYMLTNGMSAGVTIITPTSFSRYYYGINNFI